MLQNRLQQASATQYFQPYQKNAKTKSVGMDVQTHSRWIRNPTMC